MLITKQIEIDMGHKVPFHKGKCSSLHGHRYKIEVAVDDKVIETKGTSDEGMVIDFGDLKQIMMEVLDSKFDHNTVIYEGDPQTLLFDQLSQSQKKQIIFVPFIPTAENLARYWFNLLKEQLLKKQIKIAYVTVWETPTSTATFQQIYNEDDQN